MNEPIEQKTETDATHAKRGRRHGFVAGIVVGGLLGLLFTGIAVTSHVTAASHLTSLFSHGRQGLNDPEKACRHLDLAADFLLWKVNATEDQRDKVKAVTKGAVEDLAKIHAQHRADHDAMLDAFTKPTIDKAAVENIRRNEVKLADQASLRIVTALTEIADVLSPDQRAQLVDLVRELHR